MQDQHAISGGPGSQVDMVMNQSLVVSYALT